MRFCHHIGYEKIYTFSTSATEDKDTPSRTSGAVKARKSCWVTYSSVKEMLPEGMSRRDQGEMIKPMAVGSAEGNQQIKPLEIKKKITFSHFHYLNSQSKMVFI